MAKKEYQKMKIHILKINNWIQPELLAQFFSNKYGIKGLSWLDRD